ncbi:sulfurtransferase, partial [Staphylococcus aureus]
CTGGIRCEKCSGWLLKEGFEDVAQLNGGIAAYCTDPKTKRESWERKKYGFDDRNMDATYQGEKTINGKGLVAGEPLESYDNL